MATRTRTAGGCTSGDLDQMGVNAAHELKNALAGVKALVQLGLRNPAETASHERLIVVEREVQRMQEILKSHLSSARPLVEARPARVDLGPLVSDVLRVLVPLRRFIPTSLGVRGIKRKGYAKGQHG